MMKKLISFTDLCISRLCSIVDLCATSLFVTHVIFVFGRRTSTLSAIRNASVNLSRNNISYQRLSGHEYSIEAVSTKHIVCGINRSEIESYDIFLLKPLTRYEYDCSWYESFVLMWYEISSYRFFTSHFFTIYFLSQYRLGYDDINIVTTKICIIII